MAEADMRTLMLQANKLVADAIPNVPLVIKGMQFPEDEDEFVCFNGLALYESVKRSTSTGYTCFLEVICYSKHPSVREDKAMLREWALAEVYRTLFSGKRIAIESTCIQFAEAKLMALDLRSLGQFAEGIAQSSPSLNMNAVVMEVEGIVIQEKA
jgi:hypothetical protein